MSIQTSEYHKAWREKHKDRIHDYYLRDYSKRRELIRLQRQSPEARAKLREYLKAWRTRNAEKRKQAMRNWIEKNPDWIRQYQAAYGPRRRELYAKRKEEICKRKRALSKTPKYLARVRRYSKHRRRENIQCALVERLRATMRRAFCRQFVKKSKRTMELIGCTPEFLRSHIEAQFLPGMTWENRRLWHVDHIKPLASFDLRDPEVQKVAFHYTNLQPLWAKDNQQKSDKVLAE